MNLVVMAVLITGAALLQAVLPGVPWLGHAKVPALGAVVVYYALARERSDWIWASVMAGLVQDGMGFMPFGYSPFGFCITALMVSRFKELVFVHEKITHMMFGFLMGAVSTVILFILLSSTNLIAMSVPHALHKALGSAALGAVATPFIFHACARLDACMGLVESSTSSWRELP